MSKLAQKEKEFDGLEETMRMPIKETAEYAEFIQKFLKYVCMCECVCEYVCVRISYPNPHSLPFSPPLHHHPKSLHT
ncbi:hypothetical protein EON65_53985 [archaeon]|nr:MAG: hypothetical protein EON65_53985 [archaeon]